MIKKIFVAAIIVLCGGSYALGGIGDYCVYKNNICYWCSTYTGSDRGGYCRPPYAGCSSAAFDVGNGGTADGYGPSGTGTYKCTPQGYCLTSCPYETRWNEIPGGFERRERRGGCKCDEWESDSAYRCAIGYYGVADSWGTTGCMRCPSIENIAGEMVYGTSTPGDNENITDCFLNGGTFNDSTGQYDITGKCEYELLS